MIYLGIDPGPRYLGLAILQLVGSRRLVRYVQGIDLEEQMFAQQIPATANSAAVIATGVVRNLVHQWAPGGAGIENVRNVMAVKGQRRRVSTAGLDALLISGELKQLLRNLDVPHFDVEPLKWKRRLRVTGLSDRKTLDALGRVFRLDFKGKTVEPWIHGAEALAIADTAEAMSRDSRRVA